MQADDAVRSAQNCETTLLCEENKDGLVTQDVIANAADVVAHVASHVQFDGYVMFAAARHGRTEDILAT